MKWELARVLAFAVTAALQLLCRVVARRRRQRHLALVIPAALLVAAIAVQLADEPNPAYILVELLLYSWEEMPGIQLLVCGLAAVAGIGAAWLVYTMFSRGGPEISESPEQPLRAPRYAPELLLAAYDAVQWDGGDGELAPPGESLLEISLQASPGCGEAFMRELLAGLYLVDWFVQGDDDAYDIAVIEFFEDGRAVLEYWGNRVNTRFDVRLYREAGGWYCTRMGLTEYQPPVCVIPLAAASESPA